MCRTSSQRTIPTSKRRRTAYFTRATLRPGQIVLTLKSHSDGIVAIAQAIVNDAYVNFQAGTPGTADLAIDYPWIEGESYDIELLTSTGASVDFQIEDAAAS